MLDVDSSSPVGACRIQKQGLAPSASDDSLATRGLGSARLRVHALSLMSSRLHGRSCSTRATRGRRGGARAGRVAGNHHPKDTPPPLAVAPTEGLATAEVLSLAPARRPLNRFWIQKFRPSGSSHRLIIPSPHRVGATPPCWVVSARSALRRVGNAVARGDFGGQESQPLPGRDCRP
jgi:hypothetical protein